jgi:Spy/CpxP family protein refolding chaperone
MSLISLFAEMSGSLHVGLASIGAALAIGLICAKAPDAVGVTRAIRGGKRDSIAPNSTKEPMTRMAPDGRQMRDYRPMTLKRVRARGRWGPVRRGQAARGRTSPLAAAKEERQQRRAEGLAERVAHLGELDLTDDEVAKIGEIRKESRPRIEQALKQLQGLLSDDQKRAREAALKAGKTRREVLQAMNLTDEQREKVQTVGKEVATLVREEMEKIRDVLSAEQKEKLQDLREERVERVRDRHAHRVANLRELNLSDDQKARISDIRKEYRPKVHEAGNKLRGTVREEVEAIVAVIKG